MTGIHLYLDTFDKHISSPKLLEFIGHMLYGMN